MLIKLLFITIFLYFIYKKLDFVPHRLSYYINFIVRGFLSIILNFYKLKNDIL